MSLPRKSPRKRIFQEEQYETFLADDSIKKLSDINENLAPPGYSFQQRDDHVKFFKLVDNEMLLPEVTECIRTDKELDVKLLFKGSPVPLPIAYLKNFANTNSRKDRCILLVLSDLHYYYDTLLYNNTGFCRQISFYRQYRY